MDQNDPDANLLAGYTPVHSGSLADTPHSPAASGSAGAAGEAGIERKLDEILFAVKTMERNLEEMKRELDAMRMQTSHHA